MGRVRDEFAAIQCRLADAVIPLRYGRRPMARPTAISLFSGAGGLDLGVESHGFSTRAAVESNEIARRTMIANAERHFSGLRESSVLSDVLAVSAEELLERAGTQPGRGRAAWWAALYAVLEERLLARVQARRRGSQGLPARQLCRRVARDPPQGVLDGERLRPRLPESEPGDPQAIHQQRARRWLLLRLPDCPCRRLWRAPASPAPLLRGHSP